MRGEAVGDNVSSQFVSIPTREGEATRYEDIASVHALLQAGRVALALGESDETSSGRET